MIHIRFLVTVHGWFIREFLGITSKKVTFGDIPSGINSVPLTLNFAGEY